MLINISAMACQYKIMKLTFDFNVLANVAVGKTNDFLLLFYLLNSSIGV